MKTIPYFEVTLVYSDGATWFAGGFNSLDLANAWIETEKSRPYWKIDTQVQLVDKSYCITLI